MMKPYPARAYDTSGAIEPMTSATPSNQRGRQSFSGTTATGWVGSVSGMVATVPIVGGSPVPIL